MRIQSIGLYTLTVAALLAAGCTSPQTTDLAATFEARTDGIPSGPGSSDTERIQGRWDYVSVRNRGREFLVGAGAHIVITADKWTICRNDVVLESTHRLDPAEAPKHLDAIVRWPDGRTFPLESIYRLTGDYLLICEPEKPGKGRRPTKFAATKADPYFLTLLKRSPQ